jgi:hypothetical protein
MQKLRPNTTKSTGSRLVEGLAGVGAEIANTAPGRQQKVGKGGAVHGAAPRPKRVRLRHCVRRHAQAHALTPPHCYGWQGAPLSQGDAALVLLAGEGKGKNRWHGGRASATAAVPTAALCGRACERLNTRILGSSRVYGGAAVVLWCVEKVCTAGRTVLG